MVGRRSLVAGLALALIGLAPTPAEAQGRIGITQKLEDPSQTNGGGGDEDAGRDEAPGQTSFRAVLARVLDLFRGGGDGDRGPRLTDLPRLSAIEPGRTASASVTLRDPSGAQVELGVEVEARETLEPGLEDVVTLTVEGESAVGFGGEVDLGAVGVGASASAGERSSYSVTLPADVYDAIRDGDADFPDPLDPAALPVGASLLLTEEGFLASELEVAYRYIRLGNELSESEGAAIGVVKLDEDTIRVHAGPTHAVEQQVLLGVGLGPLTIGLMNDTELRDSRSSFADIDVSRPEGLAAYQEFLRTGVLPMSDEPSVDASGTIEQLSYDSQSAIGAEVEIGSVTLGGSLSTGSVGLQQTRTVFDDGRRIDEHLFRRGDLAYYSRTARRRNGSEDLSQRETVTLMNDVHEASSRYLVTAFTGREWDDLEDEVRGEQDLQLTFSDRDVEELQDRIRDYAERFEELGGLAAIIGPERYLLEDILAARSPEDVTAALADAWGSGWTAEALLKVYVDTMDQGPLPGELTLRAND